MTGTCANCGSSVSDKYVQVFAYEGVEGGDVDCCPACPDLVRDGGKAREAHARAGRGGNKYNN